jgi:pimeloyl-ACP methyl ester carboxylesterase
MAFVQLGNLRLHYLEQGAGALPLVFVHGFLSSHRWWLPTLERLPDRYRAFALDLRGAGESDRPGTGYTMAQHAVDLAGFADAVHLDRFVLVGHSMGAGVALHYALAHPERLSALLLVDPAPPAGLQLPAEVERWIIAQQGKLDGVRFLIRSAFARQPESAYFDRLVADGLRWDTATYVGSRRDLARGDLAARLSEIQVRTLVLWGDKDTMDPFSGVAEIFTKVPRCALEVWHGVGHSGPIEAPDRFVELLDRFIQEG